MVLKLQISHPRLALKLLTGPLTPDSPMGVFTCSMSMRRNANKIEGEAIAKSATCRSYGYIGDLKHETNKYQSYRVSR